MVDGMTDDISKARSEQRLFVLFTTIILAMGGWGLQNTYNTILRNQTALNAFALHVEANYISSKQQAFIQAENQRRFESLQRQIDRTLDAIERRHPPGRTPIGNGWQKQVVPPDAGLDP